MTGNISETPLVVEGKNDSSVALATYCQSNIRWLPSGSGTAFARDDFAKTDPKDTQYLDLRHSSFSSMDILYADYSVRNAQWDKLRSVMTESLWDNK